MAGGMKTFYKGCSPKVACKSADNPICKEASGSVMCDISCCDKDNCNAGSAFGASGFLIMLACALVSLMIFVKA